MFKKGAVLALHGLNSTPDDMSSLTDELESAGYAVTAPLLPGAGGGKRLKGVKASGFVDAAMREWNRLSGEGCKAIVGLSLGSMLGAIVASRYKDVGALVMLSPSTNPPGGLAGKLLPYLHWLKPWYSPFRERDLSNPELLRRLQTKYPEIDLGSKEGRDRVIEESRIPTAALVEVMRLQKEMLRALRKVEAPVLAMFGGGDNLVSGSDEERICGALSQRRDAKVVNWRTSCSYKGKSVPSAWAVWFRKSPHCLPCGPEQSHVAKTVVEFLEVACG